VRNEEVLHRDTEERYILHTANRRKGNWIGHILRRNCLLKHIIEGNVEGRIDGREDEEEDVSSYRILLRKREDTEN